MQREHRQLHAEADQEAEVTEQGKAAAVGALTELLQVEGEAVAAEGQG
jgi:hypothetical protein